MIGDEVEAVAEAESGVPCFERRGGDLPIFQNWWNNEIYEYYIVCNTTTMQYIEYCKYYVIHTTITSTYTI